MRGGSVQFLLDQQSTTSSAAGQGGQAYNRKRGISLFATGTFAAVLLKPALLRRGRSHGKNRLSGTLSAENPYRMRTCRF